MILCNELTYEQNQAGPFMQLHGVGFAELQNGSRVPREEPTVGVIENLHPPLSRDHVTLCVQ